MRNCIFSFHSSLIFFEICIIKVGIFKNQICACLLVQKRSCFCHCLIINKNDLNISELVNKIEGSAEDIHAAVFIPGQDGVLSVSADRLVGFNKYSRDSDTGYL